MDRHEKNFVGRSQSRQPLCTLRVRKVIVLAKLGALTNADSCLTLGT